jgi:protein KRI1
MYLKDYHRRNLLEALEGPKDEPPPQVTTYAQEQQALKEAFHTIPSDSDEEDLIKPKSKSKTDNATEEQEYQHFLETSLQDGSSKKLLANLTSLASSAPTTLETEDDKEAFLANYLLNRGWLEPAAQKPLYEAEDDTSDDEKAEEFETQYNFRFEAPGAGELITHARTLSSARRGDERRKKERERKKAAKEAEKKKEMEEIARLRNLKRQELEERIRRVEGIAGTGGWTEKDLEGDFDPEEWDKRMQGVFDDDYYLEVMDV